jgi:hypothetical protein
VTTSTVEPPQTNKPNMNSGGGCGLTDADDDES